MKYEIKSYPDGTKYVQLLNWTNDLTFKINSYEDLWILNQIHDVMKHRGIFKKLTIPNLLDAQADRRFHPYQNHSLKLVCDFLNGFTNFTEIKIFHPHNPEVVEALIDNVVIENNLGFIYDVLGIIKDERYDNNSDDMESNLVLMSSDAGGYKPLMKLVDNLKWKGDVHSASKSRSYIDGLTRITQEIGKQDFQGKDILIVDDISVYGGTFKGLSKLLKERNCGKLYLAVSHMTVQNLGEDPVTNYFEKVFTTNSKFDTYTETYDYQINNFETEKDVRPARNLEVIKL